MCKHPSCHLLTCSTMRRLVPLAVLSRGSGNQHLCGAALQGKYDGMTFWEQLDDGVQNTNNRKFLTLVPVVLFLLATHGTDYR